MRWCLFVLISFAGVAAGSLQAAPPPVTGEPTSPRDGVIQLFNGKDLTNFYTWLKDTKYEDPRQVFTVHDGLLHISGDGLGCITTEREYRDYHLVAEFKWGPRVWPPREKRTRDSGILVHCAGPDGGYSDTWMTSFEAQIIEGGYGDFILVAGKNADGSTAQLSLTCEVEKDRDGENVWKAGGQRQTFNRGRINWYGRDPDWKDELGFRGKQDGDVLKPGEEWIRMDVICDGGRITNLVNGVKVNEGFDALPSAGKIIIQTELAEIFFRKIELHPLKK